MAIGRYLFLDFDGVLHTDSPPHNLRYAAHLVPIASELGLSVVVSSTWREGFSLPELVTALGELGRFVVGKTPVWKPTQTGSSMLGVRQREIEAWLTRKALLGAPWVAIDDDPANFRQGCDRVFLTDGKVGLDAKTAGVFNAWCRKLLL